MKNATQPTITIESRITDVTVYLSGAQVTRAGNLPVKAGVQRFLFARLPAELRPESIQVSTDDGVVIHSVEHSVNYLQTVDHTEEIVKLQEKLDDLMRRRQRETDAIELGELEEEFFSQNTKLAGRESGLKADDLKAAVLFYNERMTAIRETRTVCELKIEKLDEEMSAVQSQLGGFDGTQSDPVSEIVVTVGSAEDGAKGAAIALTYFVQSASWRPFYDIRAKDTNSNIALHCKARVSQNTGENWEDVKLTLSSGNPAVGGECPDLKPWYLSFHSEIRPNQFQQFNAMPMGRSLSEVPAAPAPIAYNERDAGLAALESSVTVTESATSIEYNINAPYSIASGDGEQDVEVTVHSLPAKYRYFSVRKLEREVFLVAAVSEWEHLNLIAGDASIFFENRYVGTTHIDPRRASDTFDLSLGVDKSVVVTRVRGKDFVANTLVGSNVRQTRQWELTARNLKTVPIDVEVLDQVPVSADKQITVDTAEISGAELNKDTGILTWKFTLDPAESRSMAVKYVVTSPKNMTVLLE
ncbi:MAG: DUF4139 domain-containing protein [Propionibacteriaceae bacterium]|nr:DUF4139 domain-containing protein [Propionibacteriaceae bacterium]